MHQYTITIGRMQWITSQKVVVTAHNFQEAITLSGFERLKDNSFRIISVIRGGSL
jgi:hypothetical protein